MATLTPPICLPIAHLLGLCLFPLHVAASDGRAEPTLPLSTPVDAGARSGASEPDRPRLTITSDSLCPSGPAVAKALATLVPPAEWPSGTARIRAVADSLVVELVSDGSARRQIHVTAECGLRATTIAVVIATWTGELASDAAGAPVLGRQVPGDSSKAPARIPPAADDGLSSLAVPATERELGAGLLLSISGGLAPGVRIDFVQTRAPAGLGWQVGLTLPAQRERAAGGGTASWTRAAANIAVNGRITLRRLVVSADAGLAGTYTLTWGHGYSISQNSEALTGGLVAGARLALSWGRMRIWTDGRAYKWLFPQVIAVDSPTGDRLNTVALPSFDFQWAVGLAYLFH
jgi:hypothetical protein